MTSVASTRGRYCPVCARTVHREFRPGPGGRAHAACPRCGSLERHRFFALLLGVLAPQLQEIDVLLDIAPSRHTSRQLRSLGPRHYLRSDIAAARGVDVRSSLTQLPLPDASVDLLVCYHVLEHIPDDLAAMREIARVLSPGGIGLLQVPWKDDQLTEDAPEASPEERRERFGLADHVRQYGTDFEERLVSSGLSVRRLGATALVGPEAARWMHLSEREQVWIVHAAADDARGLSPLTTSLLAGTFDGLVGELVEARRQRDVARARVRRLRARLEQTSRRSLRRRLVARLRRARD